MVKQEQTLGTYQSSQYGKELFVAPAKGCKTTTIIAQTLGVSLGQESGGVVDKPDNLHIISFDAAAIAGVFKFLTDHMGASKEIHKVHIENLQEIAKAAFTEPSDYGSTFMQTLQETIAKIQGRCQKNGIHVVMFSSFTMCAKAILRSISGPAFRVNNGKMFKSPMDQNKWNLLKQIMTELQWQVQQDNYHTFWEGHYGEKTSKETDGGGNPMTYDTINVDGNTAKTFPAQVERVWEINRSPMKHKDKNNKETKVNIMSFNPFPKFDFGDGMVGRGVTGVLTEKETDLTMAFHKLGLKIGQWGAE